MAEQMMQEAAGKAIPAGYKQTEVGVIPEDWDVAMLRDISAKITDGTHDTPKPVIEGIPFLTAIHVKDGMIDFDGCYFLPESIHNEIYRRCNPEFGDILMVNIGSGTATTAVVNVNYEFSLKNVALIKPNKGNNGFYINYALGFSKNKIIDTIMTGGAQPFLSLTQIALLQVPVPSLEEQTAIANVLLDSDALIDALEQLIAKKQAIKSATMQQLLTGRTRLPAFALRPDGTPKGYKPSELGEIPEDWCAATIHDITDNIIDYRGRTPKKLGMEWGGGNIPALSAGNVKKGFIDYQAECYFGSDELYRKWMTSGHARRDDIVFTMEAPLGNAALIPDDQMYILSQRTVLLQIVRAKYNPTFIIHYFLSDSFQRYISDSATGSTAQGIKRTTFEKMYVAVPICIEEQTAIATILSDMDNELQALTQKLEKARALKQGMMQQLLTGKIRLPLAAGA